MQGEAKRSVHPQEELGEVAIHQRAAACTDQTLSRA
jgi:hypothetical protein